MVNNGYNFANNLHKIGYGAPTTMVSNFYRPISETAPYGFVWKRGYPKLDAKSWLTGWWFQPLWKILVSWDDSSQYMEKYKMFQTTNQPIMIFPFFLHFQGSLHFSPKSLIHWWNHMFSICFSGVNPMKSLLVKWNPPLISSHDPMYSKPNSSEISEIFWGVTFEGFWIKECIWFCWGDHSMILRKNPTEKSTYSWLVQW